MTDPTGTLPPWKRNHFPPPRRLFTAIPTFADHWHPSEPTRKGPVDIAAMASCVTTMAGRGGVPVCMSFIDATSPGTATSQPIVNQCAPVGTCSRNIAHIATLPGTPTGKLRDNTVTEAAALRAPRLAPNSPIMTTTSGCLTQTNKQHAPHTMTWPR
ncbi:hypothetical protein EDB86DRAFT_1867421 [Lactarius hatsudake]|nr:hypothetical protein EDB86DRAFT_1867421 [Lactarius hatsudake]